MAWQTLIPVAILSLILPIGIVWRSRVRGTRRWRAALDEYADREIVSDRRRKVREPLYAPVYAMGRRAGTPIAVP